MAEMYELPIQPSKYSLPRLLEAWHRATPYVCSGWAGEVEQ